MNRAILLIIGFMSLFLPQTAHAFGRCEDASYMSRIDDRLAAGPCDLITTVQIHWGGHSVDLRLIKPHGALLNDRAALIERVTGLAARVGTAMDQMGNVNIGEVTVMLTGLDLPGGTDPRDDGEIPDEIQGHASDYGTECPVAIYKQREGMTVNEFMFVFAHELFHCVQFTMWDGQMYARDNTARWWKEGTAEYFAHLAIPNLLQSDNFITSFDRLIMSDSMTHYEYETLPFFAWLGQTRGHSAIPDFISSLPRGVEITLPPDMWIEFAQAYLDRSIHLPGGRRLPSTPYPGATITIDSTTRFRMPVTPYTISSSTFVFARGHFYELAYESQPNDSRMRWKKASGGGAWGPPLTAVSTCDGEQRYLVAWTTTHSNSAGEMAITAQESSTDMCACPAGSWQETVESINRSTNCWASANVTGWNYKAGGVRLDLNPDKTGALTYETLESEVHNNPGIWTHQTETGSSRFTWKTIGENQLLTFLVHGGQSVKIHAVMHAPGGTSISDRQVGAQTIAGHFHCDGAGLHLEMLPGNPNYNWDFTRIGSAPRP